MRSATTNASLWLSAAAIFGLLLLSALLSGSETALVASSRARLRALADKGSAGAAVALDLTEDTERMIGALNLGIAFLTIVAAGWASVVLTQGFGAAGLVLAAVAMTALNLLLVEVLPRTFAITNPEASAARVAPLVRIVVLLLAPLVSLARAAARSVLRVFGLSADPDGHILALREEIAGAIALGHSEGAVHKEDRDRLLGALDLSDRTVDEIMTHRSKVEMIDADRSPDDILTQCLASPHTRLPVYRGSDENILGVIHAKDLLREVDRLIRGGAGDLAALSDLDILKVAMKPYFVPDTTALDEQMRQFLKRRTHFALVVDEYGMLRGVLTLEDILEEIVGEITDEFDPAHPKALKRSASGAYIVDGSMTIRDLNRAMDWTLPDDEANTIAGLVIHEAQMIPAEGQAFSFHGFRFEVMTRRDNRLTRLGILPL